MISGESWIRRIKEHGCILCHILGYGCTPADAHHVRVGQGMSQRAQDHLAIPLCKEHHQGPSGLHGLGTRGFYHRYKLDELDLLAMTIEAVAS